MFYINLCVSEFVYNLFMLSATNGSDETKNLVKRRSLLNFLHGSLQETLFLMAASFYPLPNSL